MGHDTIENVLVVALPAGHFPGARGRAFPGARGRAFPGALGGRAFPLGLG